MEGRANNPSKQQKEQAMHTTTNGLENTKRFRCPSCAKTATARWEAGQTSAAGWTSASWWGRCRGCGFFGEVAFKAAPSAPRKPRLSKRWAEIESRALASALAGERGINAALAGSR
jgi:hypothetical protein